MHIFTAFNACVPFGQPHCSRISDAKSCTSRSVKCSFSDPNSNESRRVALRKLRERLAVAISSQKFGEAAKLRDEVRAAEAEEHENDEEAVLCANDAFYSAFRAADIESMAAIWLDSDTVSVSHPKFGLASGYESVLNNWRDIFRAGSAADMQVEEVSLEVRKNMAWVICTQTLHSLRGRETISGLRVATNLFQKRGDKWMIVHHHASPMDDR